MNEATVINIVGGAPLNSDRDKRNYKGENGVEENSRVLLEFHNGKLIAIYEFGLITKRSMNRVIHKSFLQYNTLEKNF